MSLLEAKKDVKVVQSHGAQDPILPFSLAEKLDGLMNDAGYQTKFIPFQGQHQIPYQAIEAYADLLESVS